MCDMDCFHCVLEDCVLDVITPEERKAQNERDTEIRGFYSYGKARTRWEYFQSEKGKEARKRYEQSEKGKEARRKAQKRYREKRKRILDQKREEENHD